LHLINFIILPRNFTAWGVPASQHPAECVKPFLWIFGSAVYKDEAQQKRGAEARTKVKMALRDIQEQGGKREVWALNHLPKFNRT
jgi:hypothetical protein